MSSLSHILTDPATVSDQKADIASLQHDISRLHDVARQQPIDATYFAQLERSVSFRLDALANVLAAQDQRITV